jgi:hypothetical protein
MSISLNRRHTDLLTCRTLHTMYPDSPSKSNDFATTVLTQAILRRSLREWTAVTQPPITPTRGPLRLENSMEAAEKDIEEMFLDPRAEAAYRASGFSEMGIGLYKSFMIPQAMIARMVFERERDKAMIRTIRNRRRVMLLLGVLTIGLLAYEWLTISFAPQFSLFGSKKHSQVLHLPSK